MNSGFNKRRKGIYNSSFLYINYHNREFNNLHNIKGIVLGTGTFEIDDENIIKLGIV